MKNTGILIAFLVSLILLWVIVVLLNNTILWFIVINLTSMFLLIKIRKVNLNDVIVALILALISAPSSMMGLWIILPFIVSGSIFRDSKNKIIIFKSSNKKDIINTFVLIGAVGLILGGINVFFALSSIKVAITFDMMWLFHGLNAGIVEEICFRMFFFAMCVYIIKDEPMSKIQNVICYVIMVIPHVLMHFNFQTINLGSIIFLSLIYGLPFALMQKKHSLISAIGAHGLVDVIRFITFGI